MSSKLFAVVDGRAGREEKVIAATTEPDGLRIVELEVEEDELEDLDDLERVASAALGLRT
jgi:hypothetical protein